jgi:hypothetical protein
MSKSIKLMGVALTLALSGCCVPDVAEKATFEVLAPAHRDYIMADDSLTEEQKARRVRFLDAWKMKVEKEHQK